MKWSSRIGCSVVALSAAAIAVELRGQATDVSVSDAHAEGVEQLHVSFSPNDRRLLIEGEGRPAAVYELRIATDGLSKLETGADVNEPGVIYLPPRAGIDANEADALNAENLFFFNELRRAPGWELAIRFDPVGAGTWKLNGRFSPLGGNLQPELSIPVGELEHGENLLHVRSTAPRNPEMYFRRRFAAGERIRDALDIIPRDWSGRVTLWRITPEGCVAVGERTLTATQPRRREVMVEEYWWENRNELTSAVLAVGQNILSARVQRAGSLFQGGFNLVYDPSHRAHRMPHWIWSWGPTIDLLLKLSKLEATQANGLAATFNAAAVEAGKRSLRFEVTDPAHAAYGLSTVRWEPSRATPLGWAEYISTADSLFMGGWGWLSLYEETHEPVYLERTQALIGAAERLMKQFPVIPQDWIVERQRWTPHTLDESVFGTIAFRRVFEVTHQNEAAAAGRRFIDSHLEHMGRESGLVARAWLRDENKDLWDPDIKGHAWVMEGYLDAYRLSGDGRYLSRARALTDRVLSCQGADGSWTYLFKKPDAGDSIDDKGTAIWAYLLYDLFKVTKTPGDLAAARRALGWCLRHQYRGEDPNLDGAIFHPNAMAYVRRRPMTILYTTTFFGLALLEELALPESER